MLVHRRFARPLTLACATAALAASPTGALARPAVDPPAQPAAESGIGSAEPSTTIVREIRRDGDATLALLLSGSALLIAAGGAGLAGRDHRRIGRIA